MFQYPKHMTRYIYLDPSLQQPTIDSSISDVPVFKAHDSVYLFGSVVATRAKALRRKKSLWLKNLAQHVIPDPFTFGRPFEAFLWKYSLLSSLPGIMKDYDSVAEMKESLSKLYRQYDSYSGRRERLQQTKNIQKHRDWRQTEIHREENDGNLFLWNINKRLPLTKQVSHRTKVYTKRTPNQNILRYLRIFHYHLCIDRKKTMMKL